ncbi:glyoxalase [Lentzea aerocolonigenes]|uniref:Glyoxalase n=1 Tax=Lentzea aerocolonigenes TaxID=68170 RepID=A0A0F0GD79_LENAE|nr:VOC family protein [Lentzea aerocolonigenes]KJK35469.1 glyoxalase [Lentzea aerocolonigenes]
MLHHVELWVQDLGRAEATFGWLFTELGWTEHQRWPAGVSWKLNETYVVVEQSPALTGPHDRMKAGLNHLALHAGTRQTVDRLTDQAQHHGWNLMFADEHPHAGGADHYAAFLENADGFEVELVATAATE